MRLVVIESPLFGDVTRNVRYAYACLRDALRRDEAPLASHLLYPQVLDDADPLERRLGIEAGLAWHWRADAVIFYIDLGFSSGMEAARKRAQNARVPTELRRLGGEWGKG